MDRVDEQDVGTSKRAPGRQFTRWRFRSTKVPLHVTHPGGSQASLILASRNISSSGISLLHSSFVHGGSSCEVQIPRAFGGALRVPGKVVRCRQLAGIVHEIGIVFDKPVSVREFVRQDVLSEFFSLEKVNPDDLQGILLHCERSPIDQQLLTHFLGQTQLRVRTCTSIAVARAVAKEGVSAILSDSQLDDGDAVELIQCLRSDLVACPVILTTNDTDSELRNRLRQACPDGFLAKPLSQDRLLRGLAELLLLESPQAKQGSGAGAADAGLASLVESFIVDLQTKAQTLSSCLRTNDIPSCLRICRDVRGTAPSLGFDTLAHIAERTEKSVTSVGSLAEAARQVQDLINACARATR